MSPVLDGISAALGADGCILTEAIPHVRQQVLAGAAEHRRIPFDDLSRRLPPHPLIVHFVTTGERTPCSVDDVADRGWRETLTYTIVRDLLGISPRQCMRQFALPLHSQAGAARAFVVYRTGADFGQRERAFAQRIQPLLQRIDRHLQILDRYHRDQPWNATCVPAGVSLTPRELTVLILLGDGLTASAIGRRLGICLSTVNTHLEHLYRKLGTDNRLTTVLRSRELGLVPALKTATAGRAASTMSPARSAGQARGPGGARAAGSGIG